MKKILIAIVALVAATVVPNAMASEAPVNEGVCAPLSSGKIDVSENQLSLTLTAPEGKLISAYCVKAGSIKQGDGPEYVVVNPPRTSVIIQHSSLKNISHYALAFVDAPPPGEEECPPGTEPEVTPFLVADTPNFGVLVCVREVPVEIIREVIKEIPVQVFVDRIVTVSVPVEVVREVVKEVRVEVPGPERTVTVDRPSIVERTVFKDRVVTKVRVRVVVKTKTKRVVKYVTRTIVKRVPTPDAAPKPRVLPYTP